MTLIVLEIAHTHTHTATLDTLYIKHSLTLLAVALPLERLKLNMRDTEGTANQPAVQSETDTSTNIAHRLTSKPLRPVLKWNIELDRRRGGGEKC